MKINIKAIIALVLIAGAIIVYFQMNKDVQTDVAGLEDPIQEEAEGEVKKDVKGYHLTIKYLNSYDIRALVVSKESYFWGGVDDEISPMDLALAWGKVAEFNTKVGFTWEQSGRWYSWRAPSYDAMKSAGIEDEAYVNRHSSNNHIIPATDEIKSEIKKIRCGDTVHLKGYLVNVTGKNDEGNTMEWTSSRTREDTGAHSCEVFYVTEIIS